MLDAGNSSVRTDELSKDKQISSVQTDEIGNVTTLQTPSQAQDLQEIRPLQLALLPDFPITAFSALALHTT